jgi:hypothetical protein
VPPTITNEVNRLVNDELCRAVALVDHGHHCYVIRKAFHKHPAIQGNAHMEDENGDNRLESIIDKAFFLAQESPFLVELVSWPQD